MSRQDAIKQTLKRSRLPKGFYLDNSNIIDCNMIGLFTDHKIKKGDFIGEYLGKVLTPDEANNTKSKYMFDVKEGGRKSVFVLDGKNKRFSSFIRYVNAANIFSQQNTEFKQFDRRIFLRAIKNIKPNSELLAWYGVDTNEIIK